MKTKVFQNRYKGKKWLRKREHVLRRDKYLCQECKRFGRTTPATTVHHIKPIELYPELWLDSRNLYSCCDNCHNSFHDRVTGKLTMAGQALERRVYKDLL